MEQHGDLAGGLIVQLAGRLVREQLFARFWGEVGDRHTVTVHIGRIREKIEADPAAPRYIVTVWSVGYRFEGGPR
jgi:DNA-binding response OmpR family regulator